MGKVYLIIGASSDVGCAVIKALNRVESNATIYAHFHSSCIKINKLEISNNNCIVPVQADLSSKAGVEFLINYLLEHNVIPNAIVHLPAPKLEYLKFKDISWQKCEEDAYIQVGSIFQILQALLPKMVKLNEQAKVVFALSENTINLPAKFSTKYTMSKYMLLGLMKSLTSEYLGKSVNINAVSPSMIDTKLLSKIDRRMLEVTGITDGLLLPEDVSPVILRLLSPESDAMYGENIFIPSKEKM